MNDTNRINSEGNVNKIEYTYNKPISSSDLNEVQSNITTKISSLNGLVGTGVQMNWSKSADDKITITKLFINSLYVPGLSSPFQYVMKNYQVSVQAVTAASDLKYKFSIYYRLREVDSNSKIYNRGIRSSGLTVGSNPTVVLSDSEIANQIFDPQLQEEVSTRIVVELTFVLGNGTPTNNTDGTWTLLTTVAETGDYIEDPNDYILDLHQNNGFYGFRNLDGPMILDFCVMSNKNLIPANSIKFDQYALVLDTKQLLRKKANSTIWNVINPIPSLFNIGNFVRVNEFLDGVSIYDENCADQAGYIVFDSLTENRILLDHSGGESAGIIYPEYEVDSEHKTSKVILHPIVTPTFFSQDPVSTAMHEDPDGNYLICATIDGEVYFRDIISKTT